MSFQAKYDVKIAAHRNSPAYKNYLKAVEIQNGLRGGEGIGKDCRTIEGTNIPTHVDTIHINIKQFKCEYCYYEATRPDNYRRHVRQIHQKEPKGHSETLEEDVDDPILPEDKDDTTIDQPRHTGTDLIKSDQGLTKCATEQDVMDGTYSKTDTEQVKSESIAR